MINYLVGFSPSHLDAILSQRKKIPEQMRQIKENKCSLIAHQKSKYDYQFKDKIFWHGRSSVIEYDLSFCQYMITEWSKTSHIQYTDKELKNSIFNIKIGELTSQQPQLDLLIETFQRAYFQ